MVSPLSGNSSYHKVRSSRPSGILPRNKSKMTGERKKKSPKKAEQNDQNTKEKNLPEADMVADMLDRGSRTGVGGWSAEMMEVMLQMKDEQTERMLRM